MTIYPSEIWEPSSDYHTSTGKLYSEAARDHLWMHFTRHSVFEGHGGAHNVPIIVKGEGAYIWDDRGNRYLDGLAGLFTVQVGHGRQELADAAMSQFGRSPTSRCGPTPTRGPSSWPSGWPTTPRATSTGSSSPPAAARRSSRPGSWPSSTTSSSGKPIKTQGHLRAVAYHGTPQGALSITGIPAAKTMFEPLVPGGHKVPNTNIYRAPEHLRDDPKAFGLWAANRIAEAIEFEGPETVAAVFLEPVQNSGGCFPPPPGYFDRVREICDEYDVLLVSDETICAFGRIGDYFACNQFGYVPDIITTAKGVTSGYAPLGAMIVSDRIFEPFRMG
jgi:adenosylmethionine-8-amino-7-oxononanoate aminotransferase